MDCSTPGFPVHHQLYKLGRLFSCHCGFEDTCGLESKHLSVALRTDIPGPTSHPAHVSSFSSPGYQFSLHSDGCGHSSMCVHLPTILFLRSLPQGGLLFLATPLRSYTSFKTQFSAHFFWEVLPRHSQPQTVLPLNFCCFQCRSSGSSSWQSLWLLGVDMLLNCTVIALPLLSTAQRAQ